MSNNGIQRAVYPIEFLQVEIDSIINDKLFKGELWKLVNKEFEKKGLDYRSLQLLLDNHLKTASSLTDYELIAIAKSAYKVLEREDLNPERYFSDITLLDYDNYKNTSNEEKLTQIYFKNFKFINNTDSKGEITYKELYDYLNNTMFLYDHDSQRSPKFRNVGSKNGEIKKLKVINLDMSAVTSICNSVLDRKFEDSEIILNCELIKGKKQKYKRLYKYEKMLGDIIIEPDYNINSESTTRVSIIDGYHRCKGIMMALNKHYEKEGKWLEGTISVRLVRATKERAKRIVYQTFQRSEDKLEWIDSLAENDYTKFVDNLVSASKFLTIENTNEEAIYNDKMTSKSLLVDIFKETNINVNDLSESIFTSEAIGKNFDIIYDLLKKQDFDFSIQSVAGFVYLGYFIESDVGKLFKATNKLINSSDFLSTCKKSLNAKPIIKTIHNVLGEEI